MICSQRASSASVTGSTNAYVALDRFKSRNVHDGAYTLSQSTTSPDGFANSLKVDVTTADTSLASNVRATIEHFIEAQDLQDLGYGTSSAKTITVSFYVKSNKTGNYGFAIEQADNSYKQVSLQYTINSADTWERKTFTIAGDTSGVINNDNGSGLELYWWLAAGSTYTSGSTRTTYTAYANADFGAGQAINLFDSTSNEFYLTGIQLEVNSSSVATDFEHRSFGQELALCQRYYEEGMVSQQGYVNSAQDIAVPAKYTTTKRAAATVTFTDHTSGNVVSVSNITIHANRVDGAFAHTDSSGAGNYYFYYIYKASAEL